MANIDFLKSVGEYHYSNALRTILENGEERHDRTGVGTRSLFGLRLDISLAEQFPLLSRKKMPWTQTINELKWFISGSSNYKDLPQSTQHWWSPWADADGELGPIYGKLLRDHNGVDQLADFIEGLRTDPYSRRHVISLWGPAEMREARLPCCHGLVIQGYLDNDDGLTLQMYQRSADFFIGVPVNIASYALLAHLIAAAIWAVPKRLVMIFGDAHIYNTHVEQAHEYLTRPYIPAPTLLVSGFLNGLGLEALENFTQQDLLLKGYKPLDAIKAPLAV